MTSWQGLTTFIKSNYKVSDENDSMIKMLFNTGDLRSQVVFIWKMGLMDGQEEWIQIESPVGRLDSINVASALRAIENTVCGGLGMSGDLLTVRHAAPLANLDANEVERPIVLVTTMADVLEQQLTGSDVF